MILSPSSQLPKILLIGSKRFSNLSTAFLVLKLDSSQPTSPSASHSTLLLPPQSTHHSLQFCCDFGHYVINVYCLAYKVCEGKVLPVLFTDIPWEPKTVSVTYQVLKKYLLNEEWILLIVFPLKLTKMSLLFARLIISSDIPLSDGSPDCSSHCISLCQKERHWYHRCRAVVMSRTFCFLL